MIGGAINTTLILGIAIGVALMWFYAKRKGAA